MYTFKLILNDSTVVTSNNNAIDISCDVINWHDSSSLVQEALLSIFNEMSKAYVVKVEFLFSRVSSKSIQKNNCNDSWMNFGCMFARFMLWHFMKSARMKFREGAN